MSEPEETTEARIEASENPFALIGWDIGRAVALSRDPEAMKGIYRRVFGSTEGRAVLIDLMVMTQAMEPRAFEMSANERFQRDGMVHVLAEIFDRAGVDAYERAAGLQAAMQLHAAMEAKDDRPDNGPGDESTSSGTDGGLDGSEASEF